MSRGIRGALGVEMDTALDRVISSLRPVIVKGKGFVLDRITPRSGVRYATVAGSYGMMVDLDNAIHRQIYMGCFGNAMTRWARALLPRAGTFLDVGAHAGYFTLLAANQVGALGRVYAVEPNPSVLRSLDAHLSANRIGHVEMCRWALGEHETSVELHVPVSEMRRDYNATLLPRPEWDAVEVPMRRLDDCLDTWNAPPIDLMKIDVEGSEPRVLAGGVAHLSRGAVRHLMIEINGPRLVEAGSSPAALVDNLAALGFEPARLVWGRAVRAGRSSVDIDPTRERDYLFVHRTSLQRQAGSTDR